MRLFELAAATPFLSLSGKDRAVSRLVIDSRAASPESLFFCIRGAHIDRHALAADAYARGCRAFVAERALPLPADATVILVPHARLALADMATLFYGAPAEKMTLIGVTGTRGKGHVAWLLSRLLAASGRRVGYIGSFGAFAGGRWVATDNTTPESLELQRLLYEMQAGGVTHAAVEISAQSLAVGRVRGLSFPYAVLTGLGYDHIGEDEHANLTAYFDAKRELFRFHRVRHLIYAASDPTAARFVAGLPEKKTAVGFSATCDYFARPEPREDAAGERFTLCVGGEVYPAEIPQIGRGEIQNALLSLAAAECVLAAEGEAEARECRLRLLAKESVPAKKKRQRSETGEKATAFP